MGEPQRLKQAPNPNIFLIGVQKAGTTSLSRWVGQHPQVYAYNSLKDIPLFWKYATNEELNKRLLMETPAYKQQPVVLHSAANYIFYPQLMQQISEKQPQAKLMLILRNPVLRAVSSYLYFKKMLREKRSIENALWYQPRQIVEITPENNDFTHIEHGFYYQQVKNCLTFFSREQLLVLDYEQLKLSPAAFIKKVFRFLGIDENFQPDFIPRNVTGKLKSKFIQQKILVKSSLKEWLINNLIDPWLPAPKRILLKHKLIELNTARQKTALADTGLTEEGLESIKCKLSQLYIPDSCLLDGLLGTDFHTKWFGNKTIQNTNGTALCIK